MLCPSTQWASCTEDQVHDGYELIKLQLSVLYIPDANDLWRPMHASKVPTAECEAARTGLLRLAGLHRRNAPHPAPLTLHPTPIILPASVTPSHSHSGSLPSGRASYLVPTTHCSAYFCLWIPAFLPRLFCLLFPPGEEQPDSSPALFPAPALACIAERPPSQHRVYC